jgi:hypothetical protein
MEWNGMEWNDGILESWNPGMMESFNVVAPVMSGGDCGVYDDAVSYSFLYSERSDFFHH